MVRRLLGAIGRARCSRRAALTVGVLGGALFPALGAHVAMASMVTFVDQNQVWVAAPDGSGRHAITSDGSADLPWAFPSSDDQGRIVATHDKLVVAMNQSGAPAAGGTNLAPEGPCSFVGAPYGAVADASGVNVAFWYLCTKTYPSSVSPHVALALPLTATLAGAQPDWSDWSSPTWFGRRLVVSDGHRLYIQPSGSAPPPPTSPDFGPAFATDPTLDFTRGQISRDGHRVLIDTSAGSQNSELWLARLAGGPPDAADGVTNYVDQLCRVATGPNARWGSVSPDGSQIAWTDDQGVKVAATPTYAGGADCASAGVPAVISATGQMISFGAATVAPGGSPSSPAAPGTPGAATPTGTTFSVLSIAGGPVKARLRLGIAIGFRCTAACRVTVSATLSPSGAHRLRLKGAVARGKASLRRAGSGRLVLRFTRTARARLARERSLPVTLALRTTVTGGKTVVSRRRVTLGKAGGHA